MKKYEDIDYQQRPAGYWGHEDALAAVLRNVQGTERRRLITGFWRQGRLQELHDALLADRLDEATRQSLGRIHPALMGGEYLPDYAPDEVEIARIELASTTGDVISVRARPHPRGILYRAVDEYDTRFSSPFRTRPGPLTLGELVRFIDRTNPPERSSGLALCYNGEDLPRRARQSSRHFTTVTSDFYPGLFVHYEHVYDDWVEGKA